ncbi:MAG TPA: hypothetical protein VFX11_10985 [Candidatus Kapabacteria bacterium]|nr:hypothetical protein [Candidatus Kapabacteria bacterium]
MFAQNENRRSFLYPGQPGAFLFYCGVTLCVALGVALLKNSLENRLLRAQLEMSRFECRDEPATTQLSAAGKSPVTFSVSAGMPDTAKPPRQWVPLTTGVLSTAAGQAATGYSATGPQCLIWTEGNT